MKATLITFATCLFSGVAIASPPQVLISSPKPLSVRMAESEIARNPYATQLDGMKGVRKWNYTTGLELQSFTDVAKRYDVPHLVEYAQHWYDTMIDPEGVIYKYKKENYNIDHICPGRALRRVYDKTGEKRYRTAAQTLWEQVEGQPRTEAGGFWHKKIYPNQMWLDGLYMGAPFYAEYVTRYGRKLPKRQREYFNDIAHQFTTVAKYTYDPKTELFRHAWDESKQMFWCDPETGQSAHAWGRAMGWYAMALVETLDFMPKGEGRDDMVKILNHIYEVLPRYADPQTGMWYQVLDSPTRQGNYQEATASIMFTYAYLKGVRKGYLPWSRKEEVLELYEKFVKRFVRENPDGTISITDCCAVAGLGGSSMRKGDFDYYISEPIIDNDNKGVGPFIWASLEYEALKNIDYNPQLTQSQTLAFPTADGAGRYATGGRGGEVLTVTKLTDDGSKGTLRWAIEQEGARTVVFNVAGNIDLVAPLRITKGDLTLAGQTAPGGGVCVRNFPVVMNASNVIIRYMRFRMGDTGGAEDDALGGKGGRNVIIDHCSISWSTDECASFYAFRDFTMQWCLIAESLTSSVHKKGAHGFGAIWGGRNVSFVGNMLTNHTSRNPRLDHTILYGGELLLTNRGSVEVAHNIIHNWGYKACYGGEEGWWNVVGNYFIGGEGTTGNNMVEVSVNSTTGAGAGRYYIANNTFECGDGALSKRVTADNWQGVKVEGGRTREQVDNGKPFEVHNSIFNNGGEKKYTKEAILAGVGASKVRDAIDRRLVGEVRSGKATYKGSISGKKGYIDSQKDAGGWVELKGKTYKDSDGDGIPDKWERENGLNPNDSTDAIKIASDGSGYTNIEVYMNSLAD